MTEYIGERSHDAEIVVDFFKKSVTMDYTLNKRGSPHNSNSSVVLSDKLRSMAFTRQIYEGTRSGFIFFGVTIPVLLVMPVMTSLTEHKIITSGKIHYLYQQILKYGIVNTRGLVEQSKEGALFQPNVSFKINNNMWFEYELDGEYQDKIKTISLKRNFIKILVFGKYPKVQQSGWNVIFEFNGIPQSGSCIVRST